MPLQITSTFPLIGGKFSTKVGEVGELEMGKGVIFMYANFSEKIRKDWIRRRRYKMSASATLDYWRDNLCTLNYTLLCYKLTV